MPATTSVPGRVRTDWELLQGAWRSVAGPRDARLLIVGDHYAFEFLDGEIYIGTFVLTPEGMDMHIAAGPLEYQGQKALCLYRLEGGVLQWSPGRPGSGRRPVRFPEVDDPRSLSFVFRRDRPLARRSTPRSLVRSSLE